MDRRIRNYACEKIQTSTSKLTFLSILSLMRNPNEFVFLSQGCSQHGDSGQLQGGWKLLSRGVYSKDQRSLHRCQWWWCPCRRKSIPKQKWQIWNSFEYTSLTIPRPRKTSLISQALFHRRAWIWPENPSQLNVPASHCHSTELANKWSSVRCPCISQCSPVSRH